MSGITYRDAKISDGAADMIAELQYVPGEVTKLLNSIDLTIRSLIEFSSDPWDSIHGITKMLVDLVYLRKLLEELLNPDIDD